MCFINGVIPFIKTNDTKKVRIIVCFRGLKRSRILIAILDFLSPLKRTIIRAFSVISFYKWYKLCWGRYVNRADKRTPATGAGVFAKCIALPK